MFGSVSKITSMYSHNSLLSGQTDDKESGTSSSDESHVSDIEVSFVLELNLDLLRKLQKTCPT